MELNLREADAILRLLKATPLFANLPHARIGIANLLEPYSVPADSVVFKEDTDASHIYFVFQGEVTVSAYKGSAEWLHQVFGPGEFFGHPARHTSGYGAVAISDFGTVLYRMPIAGFWKLVESSPELQDFFGERRARRLRSIPLLHDLANHEIRWIAHAFEEWQMPPASDLPLSEHPGLWIVDWGQLQLVLVSDPSSPARRDQRITSGNFFFSGGPGPTVGGGNIAEIARTVETTRLHHLRAEHVSRLAAVFPGLASAMSRPIDIAKTLSKVSLFDNLSVQQTEHLAQFCAWEFVPAGQNITTQGATGHSYIIIRDGAAVVLALGDRDRERPHNLLKPGDSYGETSLFEGKQRDATVRAMQGKGFNGRKILRGAEVIVLDRRDLHYAFTERPDLWPSNTELVRRFLPLREVRSKVPWQQQGEVVLWLDRPHFLRLLVPGLFLVALLVSLSLLWFFGPSILRDTLGVLPLIITGLILGLIGFWIALDYYSGYYAITNLRVTRRDRQLLVYETRVEAPTEMIQDVMLEVGFWGRLFNYGDLVLLMPSKAGGIRFSHVPDPDRVRDSVMAAKLGRFKALGLNQAQVIEQLLFQRDDAALTIPSRSRVLGPVEIPVTVGLLRRLALPRRVISQLPPPRRPLSEQIVWRKHWFRLMQRSGLPLLLIAFSFVAPLIESLDAEKLGLSPGVFLLPRLLLFTLSCFALMWRYIEYRNDIYVVTNNRIIAIQMKPLGISTRRREASLNRTRSVVAEQRGICANLLNYGDVIIETSIAGEMIEFKMVPNPRLVQAIVFRQLDAARATETQGNLSRRWKDVAHRFRKAESEVRNIPTSSTTV